MALRSAIINVMIRAAEKAARGLRRDFGEVEHLQVSRKGPADFVSTADLRADQTIAEELHRARPEFALLTEETAERPGDGRHRWIVDPLDGTTNFLHGIPHWAISIGLEREGELVAGVVLDPIKNELYWAEKGAGCWLNDRRLRVSGRRRLEDALLATGIGFKGQDKGADLLGQLAQAVTLTAGVRRLGSAALDLAYVAAGRYDGYWERDLGPWDVAAGIVLVREAGGYVSEIEGDGRPESGRSVLAANDQLHRPLMKLLAGPGQGQGRPRGTASGGTAR
jgi:myo-inositol-1(or 4)-monophosphatase